MVVCRCVLRKQDSPESGGGCACAVCPSPVSVICPVILDDWGTGGGKVATNTCMLTEWMNISIHCKTHGLWLQYFNFTY